MFSIRKMAWKQNKEQIGASKSLDLSNEKYELKQVEGILPQNLMNNLIALS